MNQVRLGALGVLVMAVMFGGCGDSGKSALPNGWQTDEFSEPEPEQTDNTVPDNNTIDIVDDDDDDDTDPPVAVDLAPDGAGCATDGDCVGGTCLTGEMWPDGYCTTDACGSSCESVDAGCINSDLGNFCAEYCTNNSDCRAGYGCRSEAGSPGRVCLPMVGAADGEACAANGDCAGDFCITEWSEGYCTTTGCSTFEDCSRPGEENNKCLRSRQGNFCVRICTSSADCRDGYICEALGGGEGMCSPDPAIPFPDEVFEDLPFDLTCEPTNGPSYAFDYEIAEDTVAYMVTPLARDGRTMYPNRIVGPTEAVSFSGANEFQAVPAYLYGAMNPTVIPATESHVNQLQAGTHTYEVETDSAEICHYLIEESTLGDRIDMNVYFVGVPGLTAATAPTHEDMQEVLQVFDDIWSGAGISLGTVRYFDITGDDADRYAILRSDQAVTELVQLSQSPGSTVDDALSINVFFTRAFAMGGAIGISLGLPGPAGLHGTQGSGVAFTAEYLGGQAQSSLGNQSVDGNVFTGQILAHEVGHYVGLFHTSEDWGAGHDPLPDTPQCNRISTDCPDLDNLMFPYAGASHVTLTPNQQFVLQVSPLTKATTTMTGGAP